MKKIILSLILLFVFSVNVHAAIRAGVMTLNDSAGTAISSYTFSTAKTTEPIPITKNIGYASLLIVVTSGTIDSISYELSVDGTNWYTPYTTDGTTLTSVGSISGDDFTASRWIITTARLAPYIRYTITPSGSTVITAKLITQVE